MRKPLLIVLILCLSALQVGCVNVDAIRRGVLDSNRRVGFLMDTYSLNVTVAERLERVILESVVSGALTAELTEFLGAGVSSEDILALVREVHTDILETTYSITVVDISDGTDVFYFISDAGVVEQLFVFRQRNDKIYKLSLVWIGGKCVDVNLDY